MSDSVQRLKEVAAAPGSVEADGIELLRSRDRFEPTHAHKARVRAALSARHGRGVPRTWHWRVVLVAGVLIAGAAGSGTSYGRQWVGEHYRKLMAWVVPIHSAPTAPEAPRATRVPPPVVMPLERAAPALEPPAAPAPRRESARPARVEARPARHLAARAIPHVEDEPTLVATAMRALRQDHDAELAAALLDDYLRRWPNGALVEESLALAIEAANARGDGRARAFASEYLRRFPNGRFGEAARRTVARAAP